MPDTGPAGNQTPKAPLPFHPSSARLPQHRRPVQLSRLNRTGPVLDGRLPPYRSNQPSSTSDKRREAPTQQPLPARLAPGPGPGPAHAEGHSSQAQPSQPSPAAAVHYLPPHRHHPPTIPPSDVRPLSSSIHHHLPACPALVHPQANALALRRRASHSIVIPTQAHTMAEIRRKLVIVGDGACGKTCLLM